ncbi:hypothetical protein RJ639_022644 [Escallonia herrerae]|uniref:NAC domain-containing protein n=1 Tax=Escallonia herrerae TaxID=1293975 RepID=A0AA88V1Z1_9ASTE|nr:hypothetical protein RJ639_022644 [Escallonia herrerae]
MEGPPTPVVVNEPGDHHDLSELPPGFRFHPTDEEIITHYLMEKVTKTTFSAKAVGEVDLNKCEPWDLPKKAKMGEKEWYFFCQRDRKYPTGMRTNRATESGYWKATGKDKEIYKGRGCLVGMKKTLVFYKGRAPKGEKSNWVMHEFRLEGKFSYYNFPKAAKEEWVVCRVFHKTAAAGIKRSPFTDLMSIKSFVDNLLESPNSLPPLLDDAPYNNDHDRPAGSDQITSELSDGNSLSYLSKQDHRQLIQMQHEDQMMKSFLMGGVGAGPHNYTTYQASPSSSNFQTQPNYSNIHYAQFANFPPSSQSSPVPNSFPGLVGEQAYLRSAIAAARSDLHQQKGTTAVQGRTEGLRQCKVEQQFSSSTNQSAAQQVSLSQDTGLSNDITTTAEISSSLVSKQDMNLIGGRGNMISRSNNYYLAEDLDKGPLSLGGPLSDFDSNLWNY